MSNGEQLHVAPHKDGGWKVERPDASRVSATAPTQKEAIERANQIAKNSGGAEVLIHGKNGAIRDKNTVGKKDPFPPKG